MSRGARRIRRQARGAWLGALVLTGAIAVWAGAPAQGAITVPQVSLGTSVRIPQTALPVSAPAASTGRTVRGRAIPISTRAPRWFTLSLYRRVVAAGARGVPLSSINRSPARGKGGTQSGGGSASCYGSPGAGPTGSSVPTSPTGFERPPVGLGPGTWLLSLFCLNVGGHPVPDGFAWCTANFVFRNGNQFGLGTAGHCADPKLGLGTPVTAVVQPPPEVCANGGSCAPGLYAIGKFSKVHNNGLGDDFGLISLYPQFNSWVRPTMPVFGGPTGSYLGGLAGVPGQTVTAGPATVLTPAWSPAVVGHCGHGVVVGTGGTCRTSAGLFSSSTWYAWYGASTPGDSGSGVEILGNYSSASNPVPAAADLTHIIELGDTRISPKGQVTTGPDVTGMVAGTQMSKILSILGSSWTLVGGGVP